MNWNVNAHLACVERGDIVCVFRVQAWAQDCWGWDGNWKAREKSKLSGFRCKVEENCPLLGYDTMSNGYFLPLFWCNLSVLSSMIKILGSLEMWPVRYPGGVVSCVQTPFPPEIPMAVQKIVPNSTRLWKLFKKLLNVRSQHIKMFGRHKIKIKFR